ncbi:ATP-binding protein [Thalassotalea sediminis]|uniref:ATP-binding protein n=1 Tax=Thalassotalea sediminis TaxID=1759089 RepID=UPI0025739329|nr:ATP-binding protein [Thalassotalea sediminis]
MNKIKDIYSRNIRINLFLTLILLIFSAQAQQSTAQTSPENSHEKQIIRIALPAQESIDYAAQERMQALISFLKEYWQIWALDHQQEVRFLMLDGKEAVKKLKNNEVDVIAINILAPKLPEFLYSIPYATFKQRVFRNQYKKQGRKVHIAIHDPNHAALDYLPKHVKRTYFDSVDALINDYNDFDVLYSIHPWLLQQALKDNQIQESFYVNQNEVPEMTLHFSTRKSDRELMYIINESMRQVSHAQAHLWEEKYLSFEYSNFSLMLGHYIAELSEAEKQFVIDHNVIKVPVPKTGLSPFIITRNHTNITDRGYSVDLLNMISTRLGISFRPVRYDTYSEVVNSVDNNDTQLFPFFEVNSKLSDRYIFSQHFLDAHYSGIYNPNISEFTQLSDANNHTIAVVRVFAVSEAIQKQFPQATFIQYDTIDAAIAAVARGEASLFIGRSLLAAATVKQHGLANLTSIPLHDFHPNAKLAFATTPAFETLITLLNKALNNISADELDALYNKWSRSAFPNADVQGKVADAYRQASYVFFAILLIALIIFWVYYRQLQVRKIAQKKIEHALAIAEAARSEAERSAQAKINFLARMSHEIRTPMNGVLGMAEALSFSHLNKEQNELLDTLEGSARHLLALLNDVLDFSKMDAGKLTLESVPVNLHLLTKNLLKSFQHIEIERNLSLKLKVDEKITHSYYTDPTRLNQVLNNLISNAIKFTEKGSISVTIEHIDHYADKLDIYDTLRISVKDTGIGISEQNQQFLFSPFTQADTDITRKFGGTGLGLSICKEIVTSMDGDIQVKSVPGEGSEFFFTLVLKQAEFERKTEDRRKNNRRLNAPSDGRFNTLRVLIAEDNLVNVKVLSAQLARLGVEADIAYDGQQALEKHLDNPYDIIISDCHMPNMDGFELVKEINQQATTPVWLIAVTADALSGAAEKCLNAGFDDYMAKPCPQEEITNKMNHAYRALQKKQRYFQAIKSQNNNHRALFNPDILMNAFQQDAYQALSASQHFTRCWQQEKNQLLATFDAKDKKALLHHLKYIASQIAYLQHDSVSQSLVDGQLHIKSSPVDEIQDTLLTLCSQLDLLFVEVELWQATIQPS